MAGEILINGKPWEVRSYTGTVADAQKRLETKVQGGGGGGSSYNGTGHTAPVTITSSTTTHDEVYVVDEGGQEHVLRLQNWDLSVRQDHKLTVVSMLKPGRANGPLVAIHNHALNQTDYDERELARMHRIWWIPFAAAAFFFFAPLVGWGLKTVVLLGALGFWWYQGVKGRNELIGSGRLLTLAGAR